MLRTVADRIDQHSTEIATVADAETALGVTPRLEGELARTTGQLRFLAGVIEEGSFLEATIDHTEDGPTIRRCLAPIGPVAVFGASNFPLAFGVAGGDTAAALAVGCPVVTKAHPSHPHTAELVGRITAEALRETAAPPGTFSLVHGLEAGKELVTNSAIRAVGFTGSQAAGRAIVELVTEDRADSIPVYAEMSSVNPVVVSPGVVASRPAELAEGFVASMSLGAGQFCTKPGLLLVPRGSDSLLEHVKSRMESGSPLTLLNGAVHTNWNDRMEAWQQTAGVEILAASPPPSDDGGFQAQATVLVVEAETMRTVADLQQECFGPTSIVVEYDDLDDLGRTLAVLGGQLAACLHTTEEEDRFSRRVSEMLTSIAGRLVWNGWPTGVAVTWAMHHGGPHPATSDPLHTSVGAASLRRFLRPVCYQGTPDDHLPAVLQDDNPLGVPRRVDGINLGTSEAVPI